MADIKGLYHMAVTDREPVRTLIYSAEQDGVKTLLSMMPLKEEFVDYSSDPDVIKAALDTGEYGMFIADFSLFNNDGTNLVNYAIGKKIKTFKVANSDRTQIQACVWKASENGAFVHDADVIDAFTAPMSRLLDNHPGIHWIAHVKSELKRVCQEISKEPTAIVLVNGPKGSSKYTLAQVSHARSPRSRHRFVYANCHSHSEAHIKWDDKKRANFAATVEAMMKDANHGTLYFHEVEKLDYPAQEELYLVLKKNLFPHAPSGNPRYVCHVVFSSRVDLQHLVSKKSFSKNLYKLITEHVINIPSINTFRNDLGRLATEMLEVICLLKGSDNKLLAKEAISTIGDTEWLGNIRQIYDSLIHAISVMGTNRRISTAMLGLTQKDPWIESLTDKQKSLYKEIIEALRKTNGNKEKASALLNITRRTLYTRMTKLGIPLEEGRPETKKKKDDGNPTGPESGK